MKPAVRRVFVLLVNRINKLLLVWGKGFGGYNNRNKLMETKLIARYVILCIIVLLYLVRTFRYALIFKNNTYFSGRKKIFHSIMIWLVPFLWINLLKSFLTPIYGSASYRKRKFDSTGYYESEIGIWTWLGFGGGSEGHQSGHSHSGDTGHHYGGGFDGHSDGGGHDGGGDSSGGHF
jgi:hypothetical protein